MATTSYPDDSFPLSAGARRQVHRPRRLKVLPGQAGPARQPAASVGHKASLSSVVAACLLGFAASYLLGAEFSPFASWEKTPLSTAEQITVTSSARSAVSKAPQAFHEQFNLHPTQGDVEEPIATF
jgi:hypothetical protein